VLSVTDDGSSVTKVNRNEVNRVIAQIKKQETSELNDLINGYKSSYARPIQVAGRDTAEIGMDISSSRIG
jgi:hypothetical protein